jgi:hypothetical protein
VWPSACSGWPWRPTPATLPLLYGVFFALGTAETLFDNAAVSILPAVVPKDSLARANGRLLGAQMVANELVAPPLGAWAFAAAAAVPFPLDAGSFAAAAALVAAMGGRFRVERPEGAARTTLRGEIAEGVRWLARHRLLRILAVAIALMNLTLSATVAISVLYAQERLGLGSVGYGLLLVGAVFALFGFHAMSWGVISLSLRQELIRPGCWPGSTAPTPCSASSRRRSARSPAACWPPATG